jgi:iron complex transport system permease protein
MKVSSARLLIGLFLALIAACALSLLCGPASPTPEIIRFIRLPRMLAGALVGMALGTSGAVFQGVLRNPLADPYILGTSSGASLGVLVAGLLRWRSPLAIYAAALAFGLGAIAVVYRIAQTDQRAPVSTLILSGVVVSTFLNALVFLGFSLFFKESFPTLFFMLGTLAQYDPVMLRVSSALIAAGLVGALWQARALNVLVQGEDTARHLGVDPERTKRWLFVMASTLVAGAVAMSGMIGFVGLIVPHAARLLGGPDHRTLLPASALGGAVLLVLLDAAARTVAAPREIPVGVLAALCGTPFFLYLLRRHKRSLF